MLQLKWASYSDKNWPQQDSAATKIMSHHGKQIHWIVCVLCECECVCVSVCVCIRE